MTALRRSLPRNSKHQCLKKQSDDEEIALTRRRSGGVVTRSELRSDTTAATSSTTTKTTSEMKLSMTLLASMMGAETLAKAVGSTDTDVLLIDCRSFMDFNAAHIHSAHNVHCPPIVKRRSGGSLPLGNIIRCSRTRSRLQAGLFHLVLAYDQQTTPTKRPTDWFHLVSRAQIITKGGCRDEYIVS